MVAVGGEKTPIAAPRTDAAASGPGSAASLRSEGGLETARLADEGGPRCHCVGRPQCRHPSDRRDERSGRDRVLGNCGVSSPSRRNSESCRFTLRGCVYRSGRSGPRRQRDLRRRQLRIEEERLPRVGHRDDSSSVSPRSLVGSSAVAWTKLRRAPMRTKLSGDGARLGLCDLCDFGGKGSFWDSL